MARQGCALTEQEVRRIIQLLLSTDMSIGDIARRIADTPRAPAAPGRARQAGDAGARSRRPGQPDRGNVCDWTNPRS